MNLMKLPIFKTFDYATKIFWGTAIGTILFMGTAHAVEPMLDIGVFKLSRLEAFNLARDGKFPEAVQAEERALGIAEAQYGPLHPSLVPIYSDLGTIHRSMGEYQKSEQEYKWGLALLEKNMGPDYPSVAEFFDRLASLEADLGRNVEAELLEKRALSIRKSDPSCDSKALAQTLGLLGRIETNLKKYSQAQTYFKEALETQEKNPNPENSLPIYLLTSQARAFQMEKNYTNAQNCLEKALDVAKKHFKSDGVEVADAMENLADLFKSQNQSEKARHLYQSALQIDQRFVGNVYSYQALPYIKRLAKVEGSAGDAKASEKLWEKTIQIEKEVFGPHHPLIGLDLLHLMESETALMKKSLAQEYLRESISILKKFLPDDAPLVLLAREKLNSH